MVLFNHFLYHWIKNSTTEKIFNRSHQIKNNGVILEQSNALNALPKHIKIVPQLRKHEQFNLTMMQHQITALYVLYFLKDEWDQTNDELVDELLLFEDLRHRLVHEEAYFLQDQVEVVVQQTQLELRLRGTLQQHDYNLVRDYC